MFIDLTEAPKGEKIRADVLIIGAGAAGITLARQLQRSTLKVVVVEGGGLELDETSQSRYSGELDLSDTQRYRPLDRNRLRYFGGTTNHWAGWTRPLDPHSFKLRPWISDIAWPFSQQDLEPYYRKAHEICETGRFEYDLKTIAEDAQAPAPALLEDDVITTPLWRYSPPTRFGKRYRAELDEGSAEVYLRANVVSLNVQRRRIESVSLMAEDGELRTAVPKVTILAAGGLENIRLLMISNESSSIAGLDRSGWLGRGWMEHPHAIIGRAVIDGDLQEEETLRYFLDRPPDGGVPVQAGLGFHPQVLEEERMAGFSVTLDRTDREIPHATGIGSLKRALGWRSAPGLVRLFARTEQRCWHDSKVELADERDDLGMRRLRLRWRIKEDDISDLARAGELLARELYKRGIGVVRSASAAGRLPAIGGGEHHMGGLRMHDSPDHGVVNRHGRVHAVENLYVSGSAVFPTGGFSNPTLTIVALALRLAEHVEGSMT